jgi:hypothetical protein
LGHSTSISRADRALALAAAFACAVALSGCGGVEFQGKVFDYMGISGDRKEADVRMSERPPLVLPPNLKALPPPGSGTAVATARQDWPENPERAQKRIASEQQAVKDKAEAENDPFNAYAGKPTLLDKLFGRSRNEGEPIDAVPEPDPADKSPQDRGEAVASSSPKPLTPHEPQAPLPEKPVQPETPDSYGTMSNPTEGNAQPLY